MVFSEFSACMHDVCNIMEYCFSNQSGFLYTSNFLPKQNTPTHFFPQKPCFQLQNSLFPEKIIYPLLLTCTFNFIRDINFGAFHTEPLIYTFNTHFSLFNSVLLKIAYKENHPQPSGYGWLPITFCFLYALP